MQKQLNEAVLVSLRRIIRASSLYSRRLTRETGLTVAQVVVLREIEQHPGLSVSEIARHTSLSQATVTTLIKSLETRELVAKKRSDADRRQLEVYLTQEGSKLLDSAPNPLQDSLVARFSKLEDWEQHGIVAALGRVAAMMDADDLDVAPVLSGGDLASDDEVGGTR